MLIRLPVPLIQDGECNGGFLYTRILENIFVNTNKFIYTKLIGLFGGDTPFYLISGRNQRFLFDG